jgi:HEAT repeat protein
VVAYDPDTGHELWSCQGMKECVGPSAAFGHGLVYASSGRTGPVMAIDPTGHGDVTETHVRLHLTSGGPYVPTPLVYPHLLVPGDNGKMLFYNSAGKLVLEDRIRDHFTSSPVGGDGKIYWCSERGKTYVIDAAALASGQPSLRMLAVNQLGATCLATPAIAGGRLFIRTDAALCCIAGHETAAVVQSAKAPAATFAELRERYEKHRADWKIETEARIRLETLEAIAEIDDPQVIRFLLHTAQKEPHWDICEEAAKSLGAKGPAAVDSLIELLPDRRPFIRTIAVNELGRLQAAKAAHDKEALLRSVALRALARIGGHAKPCPREIIAAMLAVLAAGDREEAVVKQSALDGLAMLESRATAERRDVVQTLAVVVHDRNPRLAHSAQEMLKSIYHATPAEMEKKHAAAGGME